MNTIEKRIKKIKQEIQGIKTNQLTRADSYIFYKYTTKIDGSDFRSGKIFFSPELESDNILVSLAGYNIYVIQSVTNPCEGIFYGSSNSNDRFISCISNCKGILKLEFE